MSRRGRRSFLGSLFRLLLLVIVAYGVLLGISAYRISGWATQANTSAQALEKALDDADFDTCKSSVDDLAASVSQISKEAHAWYWTLVQRVPVVDADILCAQELASIADHLVNDALVPVLSKVDASLSDLSQLPGVIQALTDARLVVATCRSEADEIPLSHFEQLNKLSSSLKEAVTKADEMFDKIALGLDVANLFA